MSKKYKIVGELREFLDANVNPEDREEIDNWVINGDWDLPFELSACHSRFNRTIKFSVTNNDFEAIEELKPNVWYDRDKWDDNPNNYALIEVNGSNCWYLYKPNNSNRCLGGSTVKFMYIEKP